MRGFTLIEFLVSFTILAIIAVFAIVGFRNFVDYQQYEQQVGVVASLVEEARISARSAIGEESHGFYITSNTLTVFSGSAYSAGDPDNEVTTFSDVTLLHNFDNGGSEIVFTQLDAIPSATGTISIIRASIPATTTLFLTPAGIVQ